MEQFSSLHTRGSSHGGSRITRRAYNKPFYVHMMDEAYRMWDQIEREGKTKLYTNTGILVFGPRTSPDLKKTIASLHINEVEHEVLTAEEAMLRYPHQLDLPFDHKCVFERDGGTLLATKAVSVIQRLFTEGGGELLDGHRVKEIAPGPIVRVTTNNGDFTTRRLVVTAGPWAPTIMAQLGVKLPFKFSIRRAEVFYWRVEHPELYSADTFPSVILYDDTHHPFYAMPICEYPGLVKICPYATVCVDPDSRDEQISPRVEDIQPYVAKYFKGVSTTPSIYEACIITKTPDEHPIIDRHPGHSNIVFGAGFSGHGFKLSPVMGKLLCELAMDLPPSHDLTPFRLDRFNKHSSKL
ncbi:peroxisomal sarcosine oxidase-like isoform X2 [Halichondria panicea]|uniref:peroxisomal sarcosine oxidase-like isoform X2 n=1 Tax=Halichondria panicea TaxID=6063 RepID=UPI00312BC9D1